VSATEVILAAGPTVVALAAIGSAVWQQKRSFAHERELNDLAAVRSLLDDARVALHDTRDAMYRYLNDAGVAVADAQEKHAALEVLSQ
jgi:hypothetical protein